VHSPSDDPDPHAVDLHGRHLVLLSWRDTGNPEGGGAELYLQRMAQGLVARGARVTFFSAAYPGAAPEETVDGIRYVRRGGKLSVYLQGMRLVLASRLRLRSGAGRIDAVVDVQNGMPFFSRLVTRGPVVVLVHHVHREQWPIVYPGVRGRVGWLLESRVAPRLYRHDQYVTVSQATKAELARLGVRGPRVAVVHNGTDPAVEGPRERTPHPSVCVVGRLVPHKRVEHAVDAVLALRERVPGVRLTIVGSGWWESSLRGYVHDRGAGDLVEFTGWVDDAEKEAVYARSWTMALPSLKEGWGLVVGEAARHGTPAVAYRSAGGTRESVDDGVSGLLADDESGFVAALERVLTDAGLRAALSEGARTHSGGRSWERSQEAFASVIAAVLRGERVSEDA